MIARLLAVALLATMGVVASVDSPPIAAACGGGVRVGDQGVSVHGWCVGAEPGRQPTRSDRAMWNQFCRDAYWGQGASRAYDDGYKVSFDLSQVIGDEPGDYDRMIRNGWDPTGQVGAYILDCDVQDGTVNRVCCVYFTISDPVPIDDVLDEAIALLPLEEPSVGAAPPVGRGIVYLPTWLWISDDWTELTEAATQGSVTVDVFANPQDVTWTFDDDGGDGEVVCNGPGDQWTSDDGATDSSCQYTFTYPSAWESSGVFSGSSTIRWEIRWSLNGVDQGVWGPVVRTSTFDVTVVEIQTVGIGGWW